MPHEHFTDLEQDPLDWMSRFADSLRRVQPEFALDGRGEQANEIARSLWERPDWRRLAPEAAAQRWLDERSAR